jgi:hypothetical protein
MPPLGFSFLVKAFHCFVSFGNKIDMPRSISCKLPKEFVPVFPDRCVVCLKEQPGATARVVGKGPSRSPIRGWFSVVVPACPACGSRLRWQAAFRFLRTILVAGISMGGAAWLFYKWGFRNAALGGMSVGVAAIALLGLVIWEMFHPPQFKIDVGLANVDYEFRDRQYAEEFAALNGVGA